MSVASKNMHQAVSEAYEPNWDGAENFAVQTEVGRARGVGVVFSSLGIGWVTF